HGVERVGHSCGIKLNGDVAVDARFYGCKPDDGARPAVVGMDDHPACYFCFNSRHDDCIPLTQRLVTYAHSIFRQAVYGEWLHHHVAVRILDWRVSIWEFVDAGFARVRVQHDVQCVRGAGDGDGYFHVLVFAGLNRGLADDRPRPAVLVGVNDNPACFGGDDHWHWHCALFAQALVFSGDGWFDVGFSPRQLHREWGRNHVAIGVHHRAVLAGELI